MRANKRQLVVDKATELFSKHGFQAVGVDWIIDDSGVARMTLYRHFSGKDDLIREVLLQRYALIIGSMETRLQTLESPEERVKAIFDWYGDWFDTPEFAGCLFERALAEFGPEYASISGVAIQYREKMNSWIAELLEEVIPAADARHLGNVFVMLLDGATVNARAANDLKPASQAWAAAEVLLQSTKAKAALYESS
jgi:AcrR family transcriptional regulator